MEEGKENEVVEKEESSGDSPHREKRVNKMTLFPILIFAIIILILGGVYLSSQKDSDNITNTQNAQQQQTQEREQVGSIEVNDFSPGNTISVAQATLVTPGFVVVHDEKGAKPDQIIGVSNLLPSGTVENITVDLSREITPGESIFVMLHKDDGNGTFEFPGPDSPVTTSNGTIIMRVFVVSEGDVEQSTPSGETQ